MTGRELLVSFCFGESFFSFLILFDLARGIFCVSKKERYSECICCGRLSTGFSYCFFLEPRALCGGWTSSVGRGNSHVYVRCHSTHTFFPFFNLSANPCCGVWASWSAGNQFRTKLGGSCCQVKRLGGHEEVRADERSCGLPAHTFVPLIRIDYRNLSIGRYREVLTVHRPCFSPASYHFPIFLVWPRSFRVCIGRQLRRISRPPLLCSVSVSLSFAAVAG